jgi:TonB-dependent receptor
MNKNQLFTAERLPRKVAGTLAFLWLLCLITHSTARPLAGDNLYSVKISINVSEKTLAEVFDLIENKTNFHFSYSNTLVNASHRITLKGEHKTLGALLDYLAAEAGVMFRQVEQTIMVRPAEERPAVKPKSMGGIRGRVTDAESKEVLPGASIMVRGTTMGTTSDLNGEFVLRIPFEEAEVEVSYIGYQTLHQTVSASENNLVEVNFQMKSDVMQLKDIIITGALQGQQKALNQQKTSDNIKNIVSADQIGRFPDPNVAEALQRVPAVNIERDQGEGRYVLVRGLAPQFTNISINGEQIPSPEAGVRYVALDAVPADQLSSIEVSKALTPDMDGDAIGGNVNLITRTAQSEKTSINASAVVGYNELVGRSNLQGSLELSRRFLNNKLGIMLNSSYYETDRGSDNWERDGDELELRDYELLRTRLGLSSTIDFRPGERTELYFRSLYNHFTDREWRRRYIFIPNVDDSPFEDHTIERFTKDRLEKQIVSSFNLGGRHSFNRAELDYEVAYAEAIQDTPFDIEVGTSAEIDNLSIDFDSDPEFPSFRVNDVPHQDRTNPYLDNTMYEFEELVSGNTYALDVNKTAKVNLTLPFHDEKKQGFVKLGGKMRLKEKRYDVTENVFEWTGGDVDINGMTGDYTLEKFAGGTVDKSFLGGKYHLSANADDNIVIRHFNANKSGYELNTEDKLTAEAVEAYKATEDVYAAYAMAKVTFGKLTTIGGLRYEKTKVSYNSSEVIYDFQGDLQEIVPVSGETDYSFFLPQLHLRYVVNPNTNLRLAATRSYARPNFQDIVPAQEVELNSREGVIGNPSLKPVGATNLDFMVERYFGTVGIISGGLFYKRLDDFIFNKRFQVENYPGAEGISLTLNQSQNGESANLFGFEAAYQQNLSFLPGVLSGLGVYANYTFTRSAAKIQARQALTGTEEIRLPGQARHVGNFSLAYNRNKINVRLSANFNGEYITEIGGDSSEDLYVKDRIQIDATASYTIASKLRFFVEFLNITNQPFEVYQGSKERYVQREFYSWWSRAGLKFDF